ncbi:MAG: hypothetical protein NVSMB51_02800 [Solirubrobacteraceae bacterium]
MLTKIWCRGTLLALVASLALCSGAFAKAGDRSFVQTYPVATKLCARAAANALPKRLRPSTTQVVMACKKLEAAFGPLRASVLSAQSTFASGVAATRAQIRQACAKGQPRPACRQARRQGNAALGVLRSQHRAAVRAYGVAVEANRRAFWATIRSLRGGKSIKPDAPIALPTD